MRRDLRRSNCRKRNHRSSLRRETLIEIIIKKGRGGGNKLRELKRETKVVVTGKPTWESPPWRSPPIPALPSPDSSNLSSPQGNLIPGDQVMADSAPEGVLSRQALLSPPSTTPTIEGAIAGGEISEIANTGRSIARGFIAQGVLTVDMIAG